MFCSLVVLAVNNVQGRLVYRPTPGEPVSPTIQRLKVCVFFYIKNLYNTVLFSIIPMSIIETVGCWIMKLIIGSDS